MGAGSFNDMEIDAIGEIMNISMGASATAISTMLGATVKITTPVVKVLNGPEFEFKKLKPAIGVEVAYTRGLEGSNVMMFRRNDVRIIVGTLMGTEIPEESFEMDEINRSAICEVMNQMMGSSATALSEFLGFPVNISTPLSFEIENELIFKNKYFDSKDSKVIVSFSLEVEEKLKSEFLIIMSLELAKSLLEPFGLNLVRKEMSQPQEEKRRLQPEPTPPEQTLSQEQMQQQDRQEPSLLTQPQIKPGSVTPLPPQMQPEPVPQPVYGTAAPVYQTAPEPMMLQLLHQMQQSQQQLLEFMREMKTREKPHRHESAVIRPVNGALLEDDKEDGVEQYANQEMLMKVPLEISVEIGRTKKKVRDILEFAQGSLVVLDKMAGEQADLYVNGQCIARGDIVVVEDNFGIRITEIVSRNINPESL